MCDFASMRGRRFRAPMVPIESVRRHRDVARRRQMPVVRRRLAKRMVFNRSFSLRRRRSLGFS